MIYIKGVLFLLVDIIVRILSVYVPYQILELRTGKKTSRMARAVLFVMAFFVYVGIHVILLGYLNFIRTMKRIMFGDFTYQSIMYLPVSAVAMTIILLVVVIFYCLGKTSHYWADNRRLIYASVSVLILSIMILGCISLSGIYKIQITEIQPNSEVIVKHGVYGNYVELYNNGIFECELKGLFLSDDSLYLKKFPISDTKIRKNTYMIVDVDNEIMSIKKSGGQTFYLSDKDGNIIQSVTTERVSDKKSYSLFANGSWDESSPSPCLPSEDVEDDKNNLVYSQKVDAPELSQKAGFYDEPFYLNISADKECMIFYTIDGSVPTLDSIPYTGEIYIYDKSSEENLFRGVKRTVLNYNEEDRKVECVDKAFVIRAIAVNKDGRASIPVTATYFVDKDKYRKYAVLSIVADPEELYGEDGIFVTGKAYDDWYLNGQEGDAPLANFLGSGKGYEIPASFEYWNDDSSFAQEIGLRVAGGSTRYGRIKKLSFYARNEYSGTNVFDEKIFEGIESHKLSIGGAYINPIVMQLAADRDVSTIGHLRVNVFVNGEFYRQTSLIERYNEEFFAQHYGVDKSDVIIMDEDELYEDSEAHNEWNKIYEFLNDNDLSDSDAYNSFAQIIDIQSYIDYLCIRTYIDDSDYNERKNFVMWKTRVGGKWRWALYDLDFMENNDYAKYGYECQAQKNSFEIVGDYIGGENVFMQPIFLSLYRNEEFRRRFRESFIEIAKNTFDYNKVVDCIESYGTDLEEYGSSQELDYFLTFFRDREKYIVPYMEEKFGD